MGETLEVDNNNNKNFVLFCFVLYLFIVPPPPPFSVFRKRLLHSKGELVEHRVIWWGQQAMPQVLAEVVRHAVLILRLFYSAATCAAAAADQPSLRT